MKVRYIAYIVIAAIICFLLYNKLWGAKAKEGQAASAGKGKGGRRKNGPVPVKIMIVKDTTVINNIDITGSIDANEKVQLVSQTAGNVTGIYFKEGGHVSKGQLLVKVYNQDLQASLQQNQYQIALAKETEYRNKILLQKEAISKEEYETSLTNLNSLKAQGEMVKAQLARTEVRAPFSGTIGLRNISPGGYLSPATSIATLVNIDPAKLTFSVPERYLPLLKRGSSVKFTTASSGKVFSAIVYALEPSVDVTSRTIMVRAKAPNPNNELTAGSFAKINLTLDQIPKTIMVPTECVVPDIKSSKVFIYKKGVATSRSVKTDLRTDTKIQITDGLLIRL